MEEYKSFGSFAPIYIEARRKLIHELELKVGRVALQVLEELASHADPYGTGYCGLERLAQMTRYARPTVARAIDVLVELDYIRQVTSKDDFGRVKLLWILSPYVIWISPGFIEVALKMWKFAVICKDIFIEKGGQLSRNLNKGTTTTRTRETSLNQQNLLNQKNHHHHPTGFDEKEPDELENPPAEIDPDEVHNFDTKIDPEEQHEVQNQQRTAQQVERPENPSVPPDNVREIDFALCRLPLESVSAEAIANKLAKWGGGSRLAQARHLVQQHSWEKVEIGMALVSKMPGVKNPQGLLRKQLNLGLLDKAINPASPDYWYDVERAEGED